MKFIPKLLAASALLAAAQSNAGIIDFGSPAWTPAAHGSSSYTVGNVTVSAFKLDNLNNTINGQLFANDPQDGLAVRGNEDDEIELTEWLEITFANAVSLEYLSVTDLFPAANEGGKDGSDPVKGEVGYIQLFWGAVNLGTTTIYGQGSTLGNGNQTIAFGGTGVTKIKLWADPSIRAGLQTPLVEMNTPLRAFRFQSQVFLLFLVSGLMGLGLSRRRQAKKS